MSFQAITLVIAFAKVLFEWHTFVILMAKVSFKTLKCHFQNRHYYFLRIWHSIGVVSKIFAVENALQSNNQFLHNTFGKSYLLRHVTITIAHKDIILKKGYTYSANSVS